MLRNDSLSTINFLKTGHYETIVTQQLRKQLEDLEQAASAVAGQNLEPDDAVFITRYLSQLLSRVLGQLAKNKEIAQQLILANEVIAYLQEKSDVVTAGSSVVPKGQLLRAVLPRLQSGFDTAYIGSSNMSRSALTSALEWNVKVTAQDNAAILNKFRGAFETYWNFPEFEAYSSLPEQRQKLALALRQADSGAEPDLLPNFRIRPFPYQQEILDRLAVERSLRGHFRHLVVVATW